MQTLSSWKIQNLDTDDCKECEIGRYSNATGSIKCAICDGGTYAGVPAQISCKDCPAGTYLKGDS